MVPLPGGGACWRRRSSRRSGHEPPPPRPTPAGTTSHARHWLTKVPMRIGRSTKWKDTTETAKVTRPEREELLAEEPGPGVVEPDKDRPVPDVEPVRNAAHVADRGHRQHTSSICSAPPRPPGSRGHGEPDQEEPPRVGERGHRGRQHPDRHRTATPTTPSTPQKSPPAHGRQSSPLAKRPSSWRRCVSSTSPTASAHPMKRHWARVSCRGRPGPCSTRLVDEVHPEGGSDGRGAARGRTGRAGRG